MNDSSNKGKEPGESVRNQPLYGPDGKQIGTIKDVVYTKDHREIRYGVVQFGDQPKKFAISWKSVSFKDDGTAYVKHPVDEALLGNAQPMAEGDAADLEAQEDLAELYYFDMRMTPK